MINKDHIIDWITEEQEVILHYLIDNTGVFKYPFIYNQPAFCGNQSNLLTEKLDAIYQYPKKKDENTAYAYYVWLKLSRFYNLSDVEFPDNPEPCIIAGDLNQQLRVTKMLNSLYQIITEVYPTLE